MSTDRRGGRSLFHWLALLAIGAIFIAQLAARVAHRVDSPLVDDWRYYQPRTRLPDELWFRWLFVPAVDTVHVTRKLVN